MVLTGKKKTITGIVHDCVQQSALYKPCKANQVHLISETTATQRTLLPPRGHSLQLAVPCEMMSCIELIKLQLGDTKRKN